MVWWFSQTMELLCKQRWKIIIISFIVSLELKNDICYQNDFWLQRSIFFNKNELFRDLRLMKIKSPRAEVRNTVCEDKFFLIGCVNHNGLFFNIWPHSEASFLDLRNCFFVWLYKIFNLNLCKFLIIREFIILKINYIQAYKKMCKKREQFFCRVLLIISWPKSSCIYETLY